MSGMTQWLRFLYRLFLPFIDLRKLGASLANYPGVVRDFMSYRRKRTSETLPLLDLYIVANEKTASQQFDAHYFYQDIWAFKKIDLASPRVHVDVGSRIDLVGFLAARMKIVYVDIREFLPELPNFEFKRGTILALPFEDGAVQSLSCLHVVEHIGLGRYGDHVDPLGAKKACGELQRVLARGGHLYISVPIGRPRVCFNAHRIFLPTTIVQWFSALRLVEFAAIDDKKRFVESPDFEMFTGADYSCGLFHFTK